MNSTPVHFLNVNSMFGIIIIFFLVLIMYGLWRKGYTPWHLSRESMITDTLE